MTELHVVGKSILRPDAFSKVTGKAAYAADMKLPRMLIGKVLRSPHPHARIIGIDTREAERLPGVKAVVTAADVPNNQVARIGGAVPLAGDRVRYVGEAVAGVAAISDEVAEEALKLVRVRYEELPAVFDAEESLRPDAPRLHVQENNVGYHVELSRGDIEKGFSEADLVVEGRFRTQRQSHCCMEPNTCIARMDPTGNLTLWASFGRLFVARATVAAVMNLPENKVRIVQPPAVGGSFGSRSSQVPQSYFLSAMLAKKTGLPVKIANTGEEEIGIIGTRMGSIIAMKMGVKRDGTITAKETTVIGEEGAYVTSTALAVMNATTMRHDNLYRFQNVKTTGRLLYTNKPPTAAFRGFGNAKGHFALESMMDMLAEKIGMDPAAFRLKNALRTGDTSVHGWEIRSGGLPECIEKATRSLDWKQKKGNRKEGRGIGIGCGIHVAGSRTAEAPVSADLSASGAFVKVNYDGTVNLISGEGDVGQGADTVLLQICAEELGVSFEHVKMAATDTDVAPFCVGPVSSRVTTLSGNAVREAAADAKRQLFAIAAEKLKADVDQLESRDRKIFVRGQPEQEISFAEAATDSRNRPVLGRGIYTPRQLGSNPQTLYGDCATAYSFCAQVAEVEVDVETGRVRVVDLASACDMGKAVNPTLAEGQIEGGAAQGVGYALTEKPELVNGRFVNCRLSEYRFPTGLDLPQIKPILVESNEPRGPFGAKGLGEIVMVPTAPAIANAIYDAIGVRMTELPITPEKILEALREKAQRENEE